MNLFYGIYSSSRFYLNIVSIDLAPVSGDASIDVSQLSRFHLKTETASSILNDILNRSRTKSEVLKHNNWKSWAVSHVPGGYISRQIWWEAIISFLHLYISFAFFISFVSFYAFSFPFLSALLSFISSFSRLSVGIKQSPHLTHTGLPSHLYTLAIAIALDNWPHPSYRSYTAILVMFWIPPYRGSTRNEGINWLGLEPMHISAEIIILPGCLIEGSVFHLYQFFFHDAPFGISRTDGQTWLAIIYIYFFIYLLAVSGHALLWPIPVEWWWWCPALPMR
jgi:hypothetical protein